MDSIVWTYGVLIGLGVTIGICLAFVVIANFLKLTEELPQLYHLTSKARAIEIKKSASLKGRYGIFAIPYSVARLGHIAKRAMTRLNAERVEVAIAIPKPNAKRAKFRRITPLGPFTCLHFLCANYVASFRKVALRFLGGGADPCPQACWIHLYTPDALAWLVIIGILVLL